MFKKYGIQIIGTIILSAINYYFSLPALNLKSGSFWGFIFFMVIVFVVLRLITSGTKFFSKLAKGQFSVTDGEGDPLDKKSLIKRFIEF